MNQNAYNKNDIEYYEKSWDLPFNKKKQRIHTKSPKLFQTLKPLFPKKTKSKLSESFINLKCSIHY